MNDTITTYIARASIYIINQIFLCIIALEPYVKNQIRRKGIKCLNRCRKNKIVDNKVVEVAGKFKYSSDSLNSFINSAINIEYVYLILSGINNFLNVNQNIKNDDFKKSLIEKSVKKGNRLKLDITELQMENGSIWDVEHREDVLAKSLT